MKKDLIPAIVIVALLRADSSAAHLTLNSASANIGITRTLYPDHSFYADYQYAVYPELQVAGDFLTPVIRWTAYWGFWTDGPDKALPIADLVTYSYRSHIAGARLTFLPQEVLPHWPLPLGLFAGVAHHWISASYVGSFGFDGRPGQHFTTATNTLEIGLNAEIEVFTPIAARAEAQQFIPLTDAEFARLQKDRRAYKVGLAIRF